MNMAKSKSSFRWLQEHHADPYVLKARKEGYRSRAVYKLIELQQKDQFLKPGQFVIDLGAAPGGWTEYASQFCGSEGKLIAVDILPMDPVADVVLTPATRPASEFNTLTSPDSASLAPDTS